ncbi:cytochrome c maturation protein CcmE [Luminiphilus sp.]|jgi:cytochrome c-type biogenesis protein CcmE|nr:cytochrome c maturation protein CcmE [Luminiphilus sp.]MBT6352110.1 cytochrome c maturation protein CcmE [Halieaceae bacterium]MCH1580705.1 cytochrome c maturation protein CcmE [Luminiphilus sp.]MDB2364624.1 cytochrome c maturation protein CcmE [Luminiphilus sp.]MDC6471994.1 cytochrome c maturation protein CcmE [Luminiphilus sp.]|tara:strand:- start:1613 stop:2065 length:453 start_codon:yes stop_codon:yes gene_type:complete
MHPLRKQRLYGVSLIVLLSSAAIGLVAFALRDNINLFYPPSEVAAGNAPADRNIRLGGMVVEGSIERSETSLATQFLVTDYEASVSVRYTGILPDLFAEGQGVVAEGRLNASRELIATQILAKHDENYMPPEVAAALEGKSSAPADSLLP